MTNYNKMVLVDPARLWRPRNEFREEQLGYGPLVPSKVDRQPQEGGGGSSSSMIQAKMSQLDQDISKVLNMSAEDDLKSKLYLAALHNRKAITASPQKSPDADILEKGEPAQRERAKKILDLIRPYVDWSREGEINREAIPDSNIIELIKDLLPKTVDATLEPVGFQQFAEALKRGRVRRSVVRSKKRQTYLFPTARKTILARGWQAYDQ